MFTSGGHGIRNVVISLTDSRGNIRRATSNSFGYYRFTGVAAGTAYVITANGKKFTFTQSSRVLYAVEDAGDVNFAADSF